MSFAISAGKKINRRVLPADNLKKMFDPSSIAVIGASGRHESVGFALMQNLIDGGYSGRVYPVNLNRKNVLGIRCYKSVLDIGEKPDLAVIATPAFTVPNLVRECVKAGVKSVIVVSSGFGEIGKEGRLLEKELKKIIAGTGMRLLGPNCLGYIRTDKKINASFAIRNALPGKMALISQSGALCSSILDWALKQKVGFKYFISVGAMLDVEFADIIGFVQQDPEVESVAIYMESIKDARKFMSAARSFSRSKPIIVAKSGRFEESARAAISHTGSMAGNDAVFDAAFKRAGIVRVEGVQDLLGCSEALAKQPLPKGGRLAIITNAGGPGVMAVDAVIKNGCTLARLSASAMATLEREIPRHWSRNNPVDLLGDAGHELYEKALDVVLKEKGVDGILVMLSPQAISKPALVAKAVAEKTHGSGKTVLACWMGEGFVEPGREILRERGVPCYKTPEEAVRVFSYMNAYRENSHNLYEAPGEFRVEPTPDKACIRAIIGGYQKRKRFVLNEIDSKKILKEYGIPVNRTVFAGTVDEAARKAKEIGFPVALKVVSGEITHKTDAGAVALGLISEKQVREAFRKIIANARKAKPGAQISGVSVQEMVQAGNLELILGAKSDSIFGAVIMFGLGGVATEIFHDISIGLPPLSRALAGGMIRDTKVYQLLRGYRKKFRADMPELEKIIAGFSQFIADFPEVREADINPIIVSNKKLSAVDARVVIFPAGNENRSAC